uniref:Uncharacterized protein n=1 Tax=Scleropages formosus TaxID=113540 RepID=A0A8C9TB31_SCLFO
KLEVTRKEREGTASLLVIQRELSEQQQLNSKTKELIQQYTFHIQETKLKHRKLRMKFENQLQQLMDQHKHLASVYSPERLPAEVENAEKANEQLLKAGKLFFFFWASFSASVVLPITLYEIVTSVKTNLSVYLTAAPKNLYSLCKSCCLFTL